MVTVLPFVGLRYSPDHFRSGAVLAPPYDVINTQQRNDLYAQDEHNIVRIDFGATTPHDTPGANDQYTRAAEQLEAWQNDKILIRDVQQSFYVSTHEFMVNDQWVCRRGILGAVRATPWETSDLRPHERTLRGPKEDRLALLRETKVHTSSIFAVYSHAAPTLPTLLDAITTTEPTLHGTTAGIFGDERHKLWVVNDAPSVIALRNAFLNARLYVADGHHRYETAATYAAERREHEPQAPTSAPFDYVLTYLADADDPSIVVLPTHRLIAPRRGLPATVANLRTLLDARFTVTTAGSLEEASRAAGAQSATHHAFAVAFPHEAALLSKPRENGPSTPRAGLDVVILDELLRVLEISDDDIREGAVTYTRSVEDVSQAVTSGSSALGFVLNPTTTAEIIAVADADETMPQKSTYFYPKVPTGMVLLPLSSTI